jgi:hypothetical protein
MRKIYLLSKWACLLIALLASVLLHCALSGSIIDQGRFETKLQDMQLVDHQALKIYHGGSIREIPLKLINTIVIDPSITITLNNELYFAADITLKDGTRIKSLDKDQSKLTRAFISVHNTIAGKNEHEIFKIGIENISRIVIR